MNENQNEIKLRTLISNCASNKLANLDKFKISLGNEVIYNKLIALKGLLNKSNFRVNVLGEEIDVLEIGFIIDKFYCPNYPYEKNMYVYIKLDCEYDDTIIIVKDLDKSHIIVSNKITSFQLKCQLPTCIPAMKGIYNINEYKACFISKDNLLSNNNGKLFGIKVTDNNRGNASIYKIANGIEVEDNSCKAIKNIYDIYDFEYHKYIGNPITVGVIPSTEVDKQILEAIVGAKCHNNKHDRLIKHYASKDLISSIDSIEECIHNGYDVEHVIPYKYITEGNETVVSEYIVIYKKNEEG